MLIHIYTMGRFGPEKHLGFILIENCECLKLTSYIGFDVVGEPVVREGFFTNPRALSGLKKYRQWQRTVERKERAGKG